MTCRALPRTHRWKYDYHATIKHSDSQTVADHGYLLKPPRHSSTHLEAALRGTSSRIRDMNPTGVGRLLGVGSNKLWASKGISFREARISTINYWNQKESKVCHGILRIRICGQNSHVVTRRILGGNNNSPDCFVQPNSGKIELLFSGNTRILKYFNIHR